MAQTEMPHENLDFFNLPVAEAIEIYKKMRLKKEHHNLMMLAIILLYYDLDKIITSPAITTRELAKNIAAHPCLFGEVISEKKLSNKIAHAIKRAIRFANTTGETNDA